MLFCCAAREPEFWNTLKQKCECMCFILTFCTEARAGGELSHVYNLHCKLLACLSVDTSPHHAKWAPGSERHRQTREVRSWIHHWHRFIVYIFTAQHFYSNAADSLRSCSQHEHSKCDYGYRGLALVTRFYHRSSGVIEIHKTNPGRTRAASPKHGVTAFLCHLNN